MNIAIPFPSPRAKVDLSNRPVSECLEFWADDLRRRGLVAEASYLDAAVLALKLYEDERRARATPGGA